MGSANSLDVLRLLVVRGMVETLRLIGISLGLSLGIGLVLGSLRALRIPFLNPLLSLYAVAIRGTPILVVLLLSYFVLPFSQPYLAATFALTLSHAAYTMEIFRGGIEALDKSQWEAARSLSMSIPQTLRYVVLPQATLVVLPALVGQLIVMIKDTALASVIGFVEITRMGRSLMQVYGNPIEIFGFVLILYFVLCHTLAMIGRFFESRITSRIVGG